MLVLTRKIGERIWIGDNISVTVVKLAQGGVRLGIEAPPEMAVIRDELRGRDEFRGRRETRELVDVPKSGSGPAAKTRRTTR